jgi:hypothetical protein
MRATPGDVAERLPQARDDEAPDLDFGVVEIDAAGERKPAR